MSSFDNTDIEIIPEMEDSKDFTWNPYKHIPKKYERWFFMFFQEYSCLEYDRDYQWDDSSVNNFLVISINSGLDIVKRTKLDYEIDMIFNKAVREYKEGIRIIRFLGYECTTKKELAALNKKRKEEGKKKIY